MGPIKRNLFKDINIPFLDIEQLLFWDELPEDVYMIFNFYEARDTIIQNGIRIPVDRYYTCYGFKYERLFQLFLRPDGKYKCLDEYNNFIAENNYTDYVVVIEKGRNHEIYKHYIKDLADWFPPTVTFHFYLSYSQKARFIDKASYKYQYMRHFYRLKYRRWEDLEVGTYRFLSVYYFPLKGEPYFVDEELEGNDMIFRDGKTFDFEKFYLVTKVPDNNKGISQSWVFKFVSTPSCPWKHVLDQNEGYLKSWFYLNDNSLSIKKLSHRMMTRSHLEINTLDVFWNCPRNPCNISFWKDLPKEIDAINIRIDKAAKT